MNLKAFAFLLLGLLAVSCEQAAERAHPTERPQPTEASASPSKPTKISKAFLENLSGLWLSVQYREALYRTNSLLKAQEQTKFGTDLVFDGRSKGYAMSQEWPEPVCFSVQDSNMVIDCFYQPTQFKILKLTSKSLTIRTNEGDVIDFTKVKSFNELTEEEKTLSFPPPASQPLRFTWLSGHYLYRFGKTRVELDLLPDGRISPDKLFASYFMYADDAPKNRADVLGFRRKGASKDTSTGKMFVIRRITQAGLQLDEIVPPDGEDQPIVRTGGKASLMRIAKQEPTKADSARKDTAAQ
jgi:hypothetical protein